ncbi:MAG: metal-dependent hydrolase [Granulosicoccus sp.]
MDSVSQLVLGASVAHITLGNKLGKRAIVIGAVVGTLPDLDVLVPYADAIESFTYHRSWSHSLFILTLFSFVLAFLCQRLFSKYELNYWRWWRGLWLVLITHALLDAFTVYGTQIWWPLNVPPTAWSSVFIIDPLYTVPLIIGLFIALRRSWHHSKHIVVTCVVMSSVYLGWTLVAQHITRQKVADTLTQSGIAAKHVLIAPFPFSLLWRTVVVTDDAYLEGYSSLLDKNTSISLERYNNGKQSCQQWLTHWPVQRMDWFTNGAFALSVEDDVLLLSDLRMGIEDDYVFEFAIADWKNNGWQKIVTRQMPINIDGARMSLLFYRMFDESVDLNPLTPKRKMDNSKCTAAS